MSLLRLLLAASQSSKTAADVPGLGGRRNQNQIRRNLEHVKAPAIRRAAP
jgi:hypothetical protein